MQEVISLEGEAGFKALFQFATISILVVNQSGLIELANPNAERMFGYEKGKLVNQPLESLIPDDLHHQHAKYRNSYFHNPRPRVMGPGRDLCGKRKDGSVFPVEISLGHYELEGDHFAVAFINNISRRKEMEDELRKLNLNLEQRIKDSTRELVATLEEQKKMSEMKNAFVSIASHEFRTPLSAVLSSISLIERYIELGRLADTEKHINRIKNSVSNLTGILNDFLSLDKLEQGKEEAIMEVFDLRSFIQTITEEMNALCKAQQCINYQYTGDQKVWQDRKILRNILLNLLSNAIKYSDKDIHLQATIEQSFLTITVQDQGIGIPEEEQEQLFSKFFRANNARKIQGTGLGLSIVKRYVELLDGEITFESKPGFGTTFSCCFKQVKGDLSDATAKKS